MSPMTRHRLAFALETADTMTLNFASLIGSYFVLLPSGQHWNHLRNPFGFNSSSNEGEEPSFRD